MLDLGSPASADTMAGGGEGGGGGAKAVPMHRLFAFADKRDAAMMAVGAAAAVVNGLAMPFLTFLIGDLVDAFGAADRARVVHVVSKVRTRLPSRLIWWFNCSRSWMVMAACLNCSLRC